MNEKIEHFLSTLNRSVNTIKTYRQALNLYCSVCGEELNNKEYEKFLSFMKGYSSSSRFVMKSAVAQLYEFYEIPDGARRKNLDKHYLGQFKARDVNFDREAIEKVIAYIEKMPKKNLDDWRDVAFVLTLADSGFRISELCNVMRDDIDWLNQRISIIGKGNRPARVRLSKRSCAAIMDYLVARDGELKRKGKSEPLWIQHGNVSVQKKMTDDGMRKAIKSRIVEAGVEKSKIRIHDFRHYFVTVTMLAEDLKTAQELARHKDIKTTGRYAHLSETELDQKYDRIFNK